MTDSALADTNGLERRLAEAEATIQALLTREIDAVVDPRNNSPVMLALAQHALRESEEALRKSEAEYRQIVESTTDGIVKVDRLGKIMFANTRLAEMLGYAPLELVGLSLMDIVTPGERAVVRRSLERERGSTAPLDTFYRHKSGAEIAVNVAGSTIKDDQGTLIGILGVVRDVTERKKLQEQLITSDRMASVGTLAAGVAHEINNPLAAVLANLEFIDEGVHQLEADVGKAHDPAWMRTRICEPLTDACEAANRVRFIVRDLMIFSRSPTDEPNVAVDVNAVLESSLRMGWNEIRHRADLVKDLGDIPYVTANEARLGQVFLNLVVNAAQSLPVGQLGQHEIRVGTRHVGNSVVIEVGDTGCGIAPAAVERIFDAFYTTKPAGVGTGLGLAICRRIVTDMGGTLTVISTLGVGSTFRVTIPAGNDAAVEAPASIKTKVARQRGRILVVDDEEIIARIVQRALGDIYEIVAATNAWAALALVESGERFDMILCDLMMPTMTGMDLHTALLKDAPELAARMMFMTGGAFTDEARQFLNGRIVGYVEKPFDLEVLRRSIQEFLVAQKGRE